MKVKIEFLGFPDLIKALGSKQIELSLNQERLKDVLESLEDKFPHHIRDALLDRAGKLDPAVQVLLNGQEWLTHDSLDTKLNDGDKLTFMMLVAGG